MMRTFLVSMLLPAAVAKMCEVEDCCTTIKHDFCSGNNYASATAATPVTADHACGAGKALKDTSADVQGATDAACCDDCAAGKYAGASDNACIDCADGQFSAAAATTCTAHETACADAGKGLGGGTATANAVCGDCAAGKYAATTDTTCIDCADGQFSAAAATTCTAHETACADAGKGLSTGTATANAVCGDCAAGKYAATTDTTCIDCADGQFSAAAATTCTAHATPTCGTAGEGRTAGDATNDVTCDACPTGKFALAAENTCADHLATCPLVDQGLTGGTAALDKTCADCLAGSYAAATDNECIDCTAQQTAAADCTETATTSVAADKALCDAVTALGDATACDAVLTTDTTDAATAKACTYSAAVVGTCGLAEYCATDVCAAATVFDNVAVTGIQDACPVNTDSTTKTSGAAVAAPALAVAALVAALV